MSWWKNKEGGNQVIKGIIKEFGLCPEGRRELAEEFEPGSHMVIFSEQIVGRKEADPVVQVGVVRVRAVIVEVDTDELKKGLKNKYFKIPFTYIWKYRKCYCSLRFYITVWSKHCLFCCC